jgi:pimeloyl-ACP methyl ester carboxylesterase
MKRYLTFVLILLFSLALGYSGNGKKSPRLPASKPFSNSIFVEIDNMVLHYRIWPAAVSNDSLPWVLMVHGMAGSTYSWENNAPELSAAGFNVIAVDMPPFGYSDKNPDYNQSTDNRAALLWNFLNSIHPNSKWNLVGHSMGGGIVQCMAITRPEQVDRVVFVDPALFNSLAEKHPHQMSILRFRPFEWIATGLGNAFMIRPKTITKMLRSAYGQEPGPADADEYYKAIHQRGFAKALLRSSAKSKPSIPVDGTLFNKPAIAVWGDKDTWVPLSGMQPLLDKLSCVKVVIIPGAGHLPMATHVKLFNGYVINFLLNHHE